MNRLVTVAVVALLALADPGRAAWGQCASCGPVRVAPSFTPLAPAPEPERIRADATYQWQEFEKPEKEWVKLTLGGVQVGAWHRTEGYYLPLVVGQFGPRCSPPIAPPRQLVGQAGKPCPSGCCSGPSCPCQDGKRCSEPGCPCLFQADARTPNFGVFTDQIKPGRITLNGREVSRQDAYEAIEGKGLPDFTGKQRITVIGTQADRQRVLADLAKAPEASKTVVKDYAPDHWAVAQSGFKTSGSPTIYLQAADGKVLHRQDDYADGVKGIVKALRRADPAYDPAKDPDLRRDPTPAPPTPGPAPAPTTDPIVDALSSVPASGWALGGLTAAGLFYLRRKRAIS